MRKIFSISLERDFKLMLRLQAAALLLLLPSAYLFYLPVSGAYSSPLTLFLNPVGMPYRILDWLLIAAGIFFVMLLHELVHAGMFKLFAPKHNSVIIGFGGGFAYAGAPNILYPRRQYVAIGLAPFLVISLLSIPLLIYLPEGTAAVVFTAAAFNASGSAGDFYITYRVLRTPIGTYIRDKGTEFIAYIL